MADLCPPSRRMTRRAACDDKEQWPEPPFTFDFIFVSEDLAPRGATCASTRRAMRRIISRRRSSSIESIAKNFPLPLGERLLAGPLE